MLSARRTLAVILGAWSVVSWSFHLDVSTHNALVLHYLPKTGFALQPSQAIISPPLSCPWLVVLNAGRILSYQQATRLAVLFLVVLNRIGLALGLHYLPMTSFALQPSHAKISRPF